MKLLFLTPQPPYPPHAGGALRTLGLLEGLHAAGAQIDLLTFADADQPDPATTPAADLCRRIESVPTPKRSLRARLRTLFLTQDADMASRFQSAAFREALTRLLAPPVEYDVIQFEGLEVASYLPLIKALHPNARLIYDATNAEFELQRVIYSNDRANLRRLPATLYSRVQWQRLRRFERWVCTQCAGVIATSEEDARLLNSLAPTVRARVVPNGINVQEYMQTTAQLELGPAALLFTGSMSYRPNVDAMLWFTANVLDRVREAVPEARLFIVGKKPHPRLDAIRQRADVEITGFVQDVTPFLHGCTVYIAPLRTGGGTRLKLLQAMAAGCAIVSSAIGARGLAVVPGREMMIADSAERFAQELILLLRDPERRAAMGRAAQQFVCDQYDWSIIAPKLLASYKELGIG